MATERELQTLDTVTEWLKIEHEFQFSDRLREKIVRPDNKHQEILANELPSRWDSFHRFHNQFKFDADEKFNKSKIDQKLILHVGQGALKIAGAAHRAFVWEAASRKIPLYEAAKKSWANFSIYRDMLANEKLFIPNVSYLEPFDQIQHVIGKITGKEDAYNTHPNALMLTCAGLAVASLTEIQSTEKAKYVLPEPGHVTGSLYPWNYKPQKTAS